MSSAATQLELTESGWTHYADNGAASYLYEEPLADAPNLYRGVDAHVEPYRGAVKKGHSPHWLVAVAADTRRETRVERKVFATRDEAMRHAEATVAAFLAWFHSIKDDEPECGVCGVALFDKLRVVCLSCADRASRGKTLDGVAR